jgi:hypothetical protein
MGNSRIAKKVNWDKVDKEWYSAHIRTHIDSLQINENMEETAIEQAILKLCELLKETATSPRSYLPVYETFWYLLSLFLLKIFSFSLFLSLAISIRTVRLNSFFACFFSLSIILLLSLGLELEVNGKNYIESENIINGFQEHFISLATFNQKTRIDSTYHNLVEDDIHIIDKLVQRNNIKNVHWR